jgi:hypothetical protein
MPIHAISRLVRRGGEPRERAAIADDDHGAAGAHTEGAAAGPAEEPGAGGCGELIRRSGEGAAGSVRLPGAREVRRERAEQIDAALLERLELLDHAGGDVGGRRSCGRIDACRVRRPGVCATGVGRVRGRDVRLRALDVRELALDLEQVGVRVEDRVAELADLALPLPDALVVRRDVALDAGAVLAAGVPEALAQRRDDPPIGTDEVPRELAGRVELLLLRVAVDDEVGELLDLAADRRGVELAGVGVDELLV